MKSSNSDYIFSDKKYTKLAKVCDKILNLNLSNRAVVAQDFLHVPRYSPSLSLFYNEIYLNTRSLFLIYLIHTIKNILFAIKKIIACFFYKNTFIKKSNSRVDFLFISHYTSHKNTEKFEDSYFGEIIMALNLEKYKVAVAYINHSDNKSIKIYSDKKISTYILSDSINLLSLFKIYKESFLTIFKFRGLGSNFLSRRLSTKVKFELLSPSTIQTQIIANHIKYLAQLLSPKFIITTYEGHAWERLSFSYAKEVIPHIKCVSYQHAPIFKYQHASKRGIGRNFDPDIILASGIISKKQFLSYEGIKKSRILLLGSGRRLSTLAKVNVKKPLNPTCLVVPEGTISECLILFGFALQCAKKMRNVNFLLRLPPQIGIGALVKKNPNFKELDNNIFISKSSLEEDIGKSEFVLYRGSSVVIQAVFHGLNPFYFMRKTELSMDPLFLWGANERIVRNVDDFYKKIRKNKSTSYKLKKYCSDLYTNLNVTRLENL